LDLNLPLDGFLLNPQEEDVQADGIVEEEPDAPGK
jgi:hypothetical protein